MIFRLGYFFCPWFCVEISMLYINDTGSFYIPEGVSVKNWGLIAGAIFEDCPPRLAFICGVCYANSSKSKQV